MFKNSGISNVYFSLILSLLIQVRCNPESELTQTPNFVFILADDLGWADLACYGSDLHETPHLDQLASQGVRFTDAYSASPVCTPTRVIRLSQPAPFAASTSAKVVVASLTW